MQCMRKMHQHCLETKDKWWGCVHMYWTNPRYQSKTNG
ncbi:hypothetical protein E2C01_065731 [Portunus trituberculatus]|uniref:Uncharacterized protein n=1 Tax=Portunus trituberculatus TaxID=210409 RepID=A0A5B7HSL2_PORTR|nr:hypothetical protein [Portunus trituberculatus]